MSKTKQNKSTYSPSLGTFLQTIAPCFPQAIISWDQDHTIQF